MTESIAPNGDESNFSVHGIGQKEIKSAPLFESGTVCRTETALTKLGKARRTFLHEGTDSLGKLRPCHTGDKAALLRF